MLMYSFLACHAVCSFQPMEIYVDDEAKLTLHGLVQVSLLFKFEFDIITRTLLTA